MIIKERYIDQESCGHLQNNCFPTIICAPLIVMDKVVGVMSLASSKLVRLDEGDIDLLTTIGNQIAVASNNARFYEDLPFQKPRIWLLARKRKGAL